MNVQTTQAGTLGVTGGRPLFILYCDLNGPPPVEGELGTADRDVDRGACSLIRSSDCGTCGDVDQVAERNGC
jgi:hypothetical protein